MAKQQPDSQAPDQQPQAQPAQAQQAQAQPAQPAQAQQATDAELQSGFDSALEWTNDVTSTFFSVSVIAALTTSLARSVWKK